jgi:phospholipid/cholesterol/gamma-HCH transport system ATP-binding protein
VRIALRDAWVSYGSVRALTGVTLDVLPGSRLVISGPAGGGKTTLLKALAGLVPLERGSLLWGDHIAPLQRERQALHIGMVFQTDALFDSLTVRQNVLFPLLRRGVAQAAAETRADAVLAEVGLTPAANRMPETLSGGMKKRCGIARAVAASPQVLLADDPFAGLDPDTEGSIAELLLRESTGLTLVVALPDPTDALPGLTQLRMTDGVLTPSQWC